MSYSGSSVYKFGPFSVDPATLTLTKSGSVVPVPAKTLETLLILIRRRPDVLDKDDLIKQLWPDTFVQEINLTVHISRLRKVLGEGPGDHRYIVTVPKHGYGFVAPVDEIDQENGSGPKLDGLEGSKGPANEGQSEAAVSESAAHTTAEQTPSNPKPPASRSPRKYRLRWVLAVAIVGVALALGFIYFSRRRMRAAKVQVSYRKIAVLPFQFEGLPDDGYLASGISSAVIARLSIFSNLVVQPTSLGSSVPGQGFDCVAEGRKLGVDAVVDGTIEQSGNGLRLTTHLIRVQDGKILWVGAFDVTAANSVNVRDLICDDLSKVLGGPSSGHDNDPVRADGRRATAYVAYSRGLYFWNTRTNEGLRKAVDYFNAAIAINPNYARAYAALADCYYLRAHYNYISFGEAYPAEEEATRQALRLDDKLAQAHMEMAMVLNQYKGDRKGAELEFKRALELDPNCGTAHQRYGWLLVEENRIDEALAEMRKSMELDPQSVINNTALATLLYYKGEYDEALDFCHKALEMDPNSVHALQALGFVHMQQRLFDQGLAELEQAERDDRETVDGLGTLGNAFAVAGQMAVAGKYIEKLKRMSRTSDNALYGIALIYAGTPDKAAAIGWLERAAESNGLPEYAPRCDPRLAALRADPRFEEIIRPFERQR